MSILLKSYTPTIIFDGSRPLILFKSLTPEIMVNLVKTATEGSTFIIEAIFKDENGDLVVPNTINWSLTDSNGEIINNRDNVSIAVPDSTINIILNGDDLTTSRLLSEERLITIQATYDSISLGSDLPLTQSAIFTIENVPGI